MERNFGAEIDTLKTQMEQLTSLVEKLVGNKNPEWTPLQVEKNNSNSDSDSTHIAGTLSYAGQLRKDDNHFLWQPQERDFHQLINLDSEKVAKILSALGHKQRLDILLTIIKRPLNGTELVEQLNMGTTGQLYHHLKALIGADLLRQEERGGKYHLAEERILPFLLLLTSISELMDTSDYIDMTEVRSHVDEYLGITNSGMYDAHILIWAVIENSILEYKAGYCSNIHIFFHEEGSITISDNGRGIPTQILPQSNKTNVQSIMTEINRPATAYFVKDSEKGISIAIVNALSQELHVEIRREGKVFRQNYRNGIPQTSLMVTGTTRETGTSVTIKPHGEIFTNQISRQEIADRLAEIRQEYPDLNIAFEEGTIDYQ